MTIKGEYLGYKWVMANENMRRVDIYCPTPIALSVDAPYGLYADNYRHPVQEVRFYIHPMEGVEARAQAFINQLITLELKENAP